MRKNRLPLVALSALLVLTALFGCKKDGVSASDLKDPWSAFALPLPEGKVVADTSDSEWQTDTAINLFYVGTSRGAMVDEYVGLLEKQGWTTLPAAGPSQPTGELFAQRFSKDGKQLALFVMESSHPTDPDLPAISVGLKFE